VTGTYLSNVYSSVSRLRLRAPLAPEHEQE
jgi:hypothetical protein